jgi:GNAT superfamily N-acetyltransferase
MNPRRDIAERATITLARPEDADAIIAMAHELAASVHDPAPRLDRRQFINLGFGADPWFECFIATMRSEPAGFALFCRGLEAHTGQRRLWLGDLYVRPHARHAGLGGALIAAVARRGWEQGCDALYLELWRHNRGGRAFYDRLDAEIVEDLAILRLTRERLDRMAARNDDNS